MKLPAIRQTGVPSAETVSPSVYASAARTKMQTGQSLLKVVSDYQAQMNKVEAVSQFNDNYNSSLMTLDAAYSDLVNQPHFDENNQPTYRDLGDRWNKIVTKHIADTTKNFTNGTARAQYQEEMGAYMRQSITDMRGVVRKRQTDYATGVLKNNLQQFKTQVGGDVKGSQAIGEAMQLGLVEPAKAVEMEATFLNEYAMSRANIRIEAATDEQSLDVLHSALMSQPSEYLSASDVQGLFTAIRQKRDFLDEQRDILQESNHTGLMIRLFDGGITSEEELELEFRNNNINDTQFDDLVKRFRGDIAGPDTDNWPEYVQISTNLESFTEADILTNGMLTRDTRIKLVAMRRQVMDDVASSGDKAANWRGTQEGREAVRRITSANAGAMTFSAFGAGSSDKEINSMLTRFYDEVEKLPLEQRRGQSLSIANKLVEEYNASKGGTSNKANEDLIQIVRDTPVAERGQALKDWSKRTMKTVPDWAKTMTGDEKIDKMAEELGVKL